VKQSHRPDDVDLVRLARVRRGGGEERDAGEVEYGVRLRGVQRRRDVVRAAYVGRDPPNRAPLVFAEDRSSGRDTDPGGDDLPPGRE
jgi:hypothetical protein